MYSRGGVTKQLGPNTALDRQLFLDAVRKIHPDARGFERETTAGCGVGLFVGYGSCVVRRFEVDTAPASE